ncbi:MAG TPA: GAF domain-containing protein [Candidatus Angelobacter sp.]|nr:GAF domain-containing protein [Candidatus Angelobacter sp.]
MPSTMPGFNDLLKEFEKMSLSAPAVDILMIQMSHRIHEAMARYNWVGFYLMENSIPPALVVGPYAGSFVPCARIPLDQGLCGAAATTKKTVVVNNVPADPRYLGSEMVKSNLVTPIIIKSRVVAEIDVESYFANTFQKADQEFIEACAALVGRYMEKKAS